jgi:hypothetical protein
MALFFVVAFSDVEKKLHFDFFSSELNMYLADDELLLS